MLCRLSRWTSTSPVYSHLIILSDDRSPSPRYIWPTTAWRAIPEGGSRSGCRVLRDGHKTKRFILRASPSVVHGLQLRFWVLMGCPGSAWVVASQGCRLGSPAHSTHRGAISAAPWAVLDTGIPKPWGHLPKTNLIEFPHSVRPLSGGRGRHAGQ